MLHCPKCRGEFEDWVNACPRCQVDLVAEPSPLPEQADLVSLLSDLGRLLRNPRVMLVLAGAAMFVSICGAVSFSVAMATTTGADAWFFSGLILTSLSTAIYAPGVLLGLVAMVMPAPNGWSVDPRRVSGLLVTAAVVVFLLGVGCQIAMVAHMARFQSGWLTTATFFVGLAGSLFNSGVLLGLGHLCLRRAVALGSPKAPPATPEP